jgi:hypothetical protein
MNPIRTTRQGGSWQHEALNPSAAAATHQAALSSERRLTLHYQAGSSEGSASSDKEWHRVTNREAEMGNYIVNGEVVDVREERPTAADLKRYSKSVLSDWVMASMPDGQIVKIEDNRPLPANAVDYSVVTPFTYGSTERSG